MGDKERNVSKELSDRIRGIQCNYRVNHERVSVPLDCFVEEDVVYQMVVGKGSKRVGYVKAGVAYRGISRDSVSL